MTRTGSPSHSTNSPKPLIAKHFAGRPLVWANCDPDGNLTYHAHYFGHGHITRFKQAHIKNLAAKAGAQEFLSWFSTPQDDYRGEFMRLLFYVDGPYDAPKLRNAAAMVRALFEQEGRDSICLLGGEGGIHIWVPIAGAPLLTDILAYARTCAKNLVERHPDTFTHQPNKVHNGLVHVHHTHNTHDTYTSAPYSYRPLTGTVATPIHWEELPTVDLLGVKVADFQARVNAMGDVFGDELAACTPKPLPQQPPAKMYGKVGNKRGTLIQATVNILADGKPRTADDILKEALAQGAIAHTTAVVMYVSLISYITRCQGRGRKPAIVEDPDKRFRLNEPPDNWPAIPPAPASPLSEEKQKIIDRLHATVDGTDPDGFEAAVCDAFRALNFVATHIGGKANPDGYVDAQLGTLGYRAMIECKSGNAIHTAGVFEAAKYKEMYQADYCAIVGDDFGDNYELIQECKTHGVSAWGISDLEALLRMNANALEIKALFQPGVIVADAIEDLVWDRNHGRAKHVRICAEIIRSAGWATQSAATISGSPSDAPVITEDAAMLLVDQELRAQRKRQLLSRRRARRVRLAYAPIGSGSNAQQRRRGDRYPFTVSPVGERRKIPALASQRT